MANAARESSYIFRLIASGAQQVEAAFSGIKQSGKDAFKTIETASVNTNKSLKSLSGLNNVFSNLKAGYASLVAAMGLGGLVAAGKQALDFAAGLEQASRNANTTVTALQELNYAAGQYGITNEAMVASLGELTKRAKEFADTGGGPAADAFKALGISQERVAELSQDSSVLFEQLIGTIRGLDDEAAKVRLVDMFFGGGGDDLVRLTGDSARAIADLRAEAQALGVVLSDDMAARAVDANQKLDALYLQLTTRLKVGLVEVTLGVADMASAMGGLSDEAQESIDWLKQFSEEVGTASIKALAFAKNWAAFMTGNYRNAGALGGPLTQFLEARGADAKTDASAGGSDKVNSDVVATVMGSSAKTSASTSTAGGSRGRLVIGTNKEAEAESKKAAADAERYAERVRDLTLAMEDEIRITGLSERQQAVARAERRLGTEATEEQREQMRELAGTLYDVQEAERRTEEASRNLASTFEDTLGEALKGNLKSWEDWESSVLDIAANVAEGIAARLGTNAGLSGLTTILADSLVGAFGGSVTTSSASAKPVVAGGRATTGPINAGSMYRVNEWSDEYLVSPLGGRVVNADQLGGSAPKVTMIVNNNSPAKVSTEEQSGPDGVTLIAIIDDATASNINRAGSKTNRALSNYNSSQSIRRR